MRIYLKIALDAVQFARTALEVAEKQFGPSHPHVAISLNNLATLYTAQGKYTEAEHLYKQALAVLEIAPINSDNWVRIPSDDYIVAHPVGTIEVRQNVVPLEFNLTRVGNSAPQEEIKFEITGVSVGDTGDKIELEICPDKDRFAQGQFLDMKDSEKLSNPPFEKMDAGIALNSDKINFSFLVSYPLDYEPNVIRDFYLATVLENMAECYKKIGKKEEAERLEKRANKIRPTR